MPQKAAPAAIRPHARALRPRSRRPAPRGGRSPRSAGPASPSLAAGMRRPAEAELLRLPEARRRMADRPDGARQADLAEIDHVGGQRRGEARGDQRRGDREVGGRLADAQAAGDVEIDVAVAEADAAVRLQHGQHHGEPAGIPADARRAAACRARSGRPAPGSPPAPAACPPCRRRRPRRASRRCARRGTARTGWRLREGRAPVISKTPISSVGPKRFLTARRMRKWWPPSPSK